MTTDYTAMEANEMVNECGTNALKWAEAFAQHARKQGVEIDVDMALGWFANAIERTKSEIHWAAEKKLNAAEAVYGFAGWLTSREAPITMSSKHYAGPAVDAIRQFIDANQLGDVGPNWPNNLTHPR